MGHGALTPRLKLRDLPRLALNRFVQLLIVAALEKIREDLEDAPPPL
jgi:hypothetical protein